MLDENLWPLQVWLPRWSLVLPLSAFLKAWLQSNSVFIHRDRFSFSKASASVASSTVGIMNNGSQRLQRAWVRPACCCDFTWVISSYRLTSPGRLAWLVTPFYKWGRQILENSVTWTRLSSFMWNFLENSGLKSCSWVYPATSRFWPGILCRPA